MKKIKYKDYYFEVDSVSNNNIYTRLISDIKVAKQDPIISYFLSNRNKLFSEEFLSFVSLTGIDITKENEIFHYVIDDAKIAVEGWYDIVGKVLSDTPVSLYFDSDISTTNFYFENGKNNAARNEFRNQTTFRFSFVIVIDKDLD